MEGATPSKQYQSEQKQSQTVPWLTPGQYYETDIVAGNSRSKTLLQAKN